MLVRVDVIRALEQCGGAASWRRLRAMGVTWYSVWASVNDGRVVRLRRGAYAVREADPPVTHAVRLGGVLSCTSAAASLGLPVLVDRGVHVTVPRTWGHARRAGVCVHRRDLLPHEQDDLCTAMLRTVLDCARELPLREAAVIGDAALRAGLPLECLVVAAGRATGPGARSLRTAVTVMDCRAESPIETCLRLLLIGVGWVDPQVWIDGVGRVDFVVEGWLVVEADGFEHHSTRQHYREDRRRSNELVARGYRLLRFSYEDVVHRPDYVVATVLAVLAHKAA
jgi:very-short-patch-repair endonuclease